MRKILPLSFALAVCATTASASENIYGRIDTGYSWTSNMNRDLGSNDAGNSAILGVGIGYHVNDHIRTDATLAYRGWYKYEGSTMIGASTFSGQADISSTVGMVNAYYDIGHYDRFTPYVGGGIGFSSNHVKSASLSLNGTPIGGIDSDTHTSFAWQLGAGTAINVAQGIALDVGYRYIDMGTAKTGDTATISGTPIPGATLQGNLRASELQAGVRITF